MKEKSLRQLARELKVSASYLSQVKNGKRPPSERILNALNPEVLSKLLGSVKHSTFDTSRIDSYNSIRSAELCSGSTGDFGSSSPGSNPGSAAIV